MPRLFKTICAALIASCVAAPVVAGSALSPIGSWEVSTGEARYKVTNCGKNGEICAKLIWLRDDARTKENLRYLNKNVVTGAVPASADNKWTGTVNYEGEAIRGSVTMVNNNTLKLTGCKMIACTSFQFRRI